MAFNKHMHPRNPFYKNAPDFKQLASLYPEFATHCRFSNKDDDAQKCHIDFRDPHALRALTCTLAQHMFDLKLTIPVDCLIPRLPQRVNYILWIEDLLDRPDKARGVDIGCGVCCIFGLLACRMNKKWTMLASDVSTETIKLARENVEANNLLDQIQIEEVSDRTILKELFDKKTVEFDFVMCNPPFYSSVSECEKTSDHEARKPAKRPLPKSINTGKTHETVHNDGGEVGFVKQMIDESLLFSHRIKIFTTMLGKKSSVIELKDYLTKEKNIENICETQFYQGHTMRWALAWSFGHEKLPDTVTKTKETQKKKYGPIVVPLEKQHFEKYEISHMLDYFRQLFVDELKMEQVGDTTSYRARANTWSNQRAKRRMKERGVSDDKHLIKPIELDFKFKLSRRSSDSRIYLELDSSSIELAITREHLNQLSQYLQNRLASKCKHL